MSDHTPEGGPAAETSAAGVAQLDQILWKRLAEATTDEEYAYSWLGLQARLIGGVAGGAVFLEEPETGAPVLAAVWPSGFDAERVAGAVERVVRERKGVVLRGESGARDDGASFLLAYPVIATGAIRGVAAVAATPRGHAELQSSMRALQWGVAWLQNRLLLRSAVPDARTTARLRTAVELAGMALEAERFKGAATAVVTELATRLDCDRVSIGFRSGSQVKVAALSHSAQFGKQMNLIRAIGLAMGEATDQQATLVHPEPAGSTHVLHAHEQLARDHSSAAICTVPFVARDGAAIGAMTFERSSVAPFDDEALEVCDGVAALLGPLLEEKRRNDRWLVQKTWDSLVTQVRRLVGPRHVARKLIAAAVLIAAIFFVFAHGTYRVSADATLEGEVRRVVAAPFRGFIQEAHVRGGDLVSTGQTLVTLDVRDLRLEYSRWASEREQYVVEHRRALAEGDRAAVNVLQKKMRQAEAQIALIQEQIDRATIRAPFDGLVVSGDLSQALGAPVDAGQVLYEVAPLDSYRVELHVDEHDVEQIATGQHGRLVLAAMPDERIPFVVSSVTPVSLTEEGSTYFVVEARLAQTTERLRPGMEGYGKIDIERRRLIWIWTHPMVDWVRLKAWRWLP